MSIYSSQKVNRRTFVKGIVGATLAPAFLRNKQAWAASPRIRKDVWSVASTDPFWNDYSDAIAAMHALPENDQRSWRGQALIHLNHCVHGQSHFVHWHRWYLHYFEQICAKLIGKTDFTLPYWNWNQNSNNSSLPDGFFDLEKLNVSFWKDKSDAASDNWGPVSTVGVRALTKGQRMIDMPRYAKAFQDKTLTDIKHATSFQIFTGLLEGQPHGTAHVAVGDGDNGSNGHMASGMSALDPIFWLHHCNVDRYWAEWQAAGNDTGEMLFDYNENFVDANGSFATGTNATGAISTIPFGYTYDTLESAHVAEISGHLDIQSLNSVNGSGSLFRNQKATQPELLGISTVGQPSLVNIENAILVQVKNLTKALSSDRFFNTPLSLGLPRLGLEPGRIVARFDGVMSPENKSLVMGVFVNCPYLNSETPSTDPLCAGIITFFGAGHHHDGKMGLSKYVDLTDVIRKLAVDGRLGSNALKVQLMLVDPSGKADQSTKVELETVVLMSA